MRYSYKPENVCASKILIDLDAQSGIIRSVEFKDGCAGNSLGLASLLAGTRADEAVAKLRGVKCGSRNTSCPDQLAKALSLAVKEAGREA